MQVSSSLSFTLFSHPSQNQVFLPPSATLDGNAVLSCEMKKKVEIEPNEDEEQSEKSDDDPFPSSESDGD
jgi:hypothetical protein